MAAIDAHRQAAGASSSARAGVRSGIVRGLRRIGAGRDSDRRTGGLVSGMKASFILRHMRNKR
ncbi:hypothetical protein [Nonomuraea sp. NPDC050691]|uniref:hypothetical protein n=1 Tax=Nonomuraea sp. NPDC050691 TaxID=3155661 RepID=UPI0034051D7B